MSGNFLFLGVQVGSTLGQHEVLDAKQPNQNQLLEKNYPSRHEALLNRIPRWASQG